MKSVNYLLLIVIALALTVSSCKENSKSAKEILTTGSWKMSTQKYNGELITIDDCEKDDYITFAADGTYIYSIGANTCYDGETNDNGTWTLSADEKTITVDGDDASVVITESQVVITITDGSDILEMIYIPK
jgi:hypothetical protein